MSPAGEGQTQKKEKKKKERKKEEKSSTLWVEMLTMWQKEKERS